MLIGIEGDAHDPQLPGGGSPWWYVGGVATIALGYGLVRLTAYAWSKMVQSMQESHKAKLESSRAEEQAQRERERELDQQRKEARRDAATEAWDVVTRLNGEVKDLNERIRELEERHAAVMTALREQHADIVAKHQERTDECEREHRAARIQLARTEGRLSVIEAWARARGLKIPPAVEPGSASHTPLPPDVVGKEHR